MRFVGTIEGTPVPAGLVRIHNGRVYLLQDVKDGSTPLDEDTKGFAFSWSLGVARGVCDLQASDWFMFEASPLPKLENPLGDGICTICAKKTKYQFCAICHKKRAKIKQGGLVKSYHASVDWTPYRLERERPDARYIGLELEVETGGNTALVHGSGIEEFPFIAHVTHDSSLTNGYEYISHPMTHGYFQKYYNEFLGFCRAQKFKSHETTTCGLHVHVNRVAMSSQDIHKMIVLAHLLENDLRKFSRRKVHAWNRYTKATIPGDANDVLRVLRGYTGSVDDKYRAVNITKRSTIEFRMFRGSLVWSTVQASVELCLYLIEFAQKPNMFLKIEKAIQDSTALAKLRKTFWSVPKKKYPALAGYVRARGIV
jgi:hypothetical protein